MGIERRRKWAPTIQHPIAMIPPRAKPERELPPHLTAIAISGSRQRAKKVSPHILAILTGQQSPLYSVRRRRGHFSSSSLRWRKGTPHSRKKVPISTGWWSGKDQLGVEGFLAPSRSLLLSSALYIGVAERVFAPLLSHFQKKVAFSFFFFFHSHAPANDNGSLFGWADYSVPPFHPFFLLFLFVWEEKGATTIPTMQVDKFEVV